MGGWVDGWAGYVMISRRLLLEDRLVFPWPAPTMRLEPKPSNTLRMHSFPFVWCCNEHVHVEKPSFYYTRACVSHDLLLMTVALWILISINREVRDV